MSQLLRKIKLPHQILFIILLGFLVSLYFSIPYLDKNKDTSINQCKSDKNYYQTGEFNIKTPDHCQKSPQWPILPVAK